MKTIKKRAVLILRIVVALILIQTLRFKFTAHPDSVYIFSKIGMEPYGRIVVGIFELFAGILLLVPKSIWLGAGLTIGLMLGAVIMHLTMLGIEVNDDGGVLFATAIVTLVLAMIILFKERRSIPFLKA